MSPLRIVALPGADRQRESAWPAPSPEGDLGGAVLLGFGWRRAAGMCLLLAYSVLKSKESSFQRLYP